MRSVRPTGIPEWWLRHAWLHQLFDGTGLATRDGRPVQVLVPGILNRDGGPDFRDARVRIGSTLFRGDIELHRDASDWVAHKHQTDPHYNSVILHVVLTTATPAPSSRTASGRLLPLLVLHPFLDPKLEGYVDESLFRPSDVDNPPIPCAGRAACLPATTIRAWIERLADDRFEMRIGNFNERLMELIDRDPSVLREPHPLYFETPAETQPPLRAYTTADLSRQQPWEQILYEGIMEGLGYSKNRDPFRSLARNLPVQRLRQLGLTNTGTLLAALFGSAGLLPSPRIVQDRESRKYLLCLRSKWNELRPLLKIPILHEAEWTFFRLRPSNFPTARLAAMTFLLPSLFSDNPLRTILPLLTSPSLTETQRHNGLHRMLSVRPDWHWIRRVQFGPPGTHGATIGRSRQIDLLANTILPLAALFGRTFNDSELAENTQRIYSALPLSDADTITRQVSRQLIRRSFRLTSARQQQGILHLYRFFCSQGRCDSCAINTLRP